MIQVILSDEQVRAIGQANGEVELRDGQGKLLGYVILQVKGASEGDAQVAGETEQNALRQAMELRRQWMRTMGVPEDEIEEYCDSGAYPASLTEEIDNLKAARQIDEMNRANR